MVEQRQRRIIPQNFVYERRSSSIGTPVPANTSGYLLLEWFVPKDKTAVIYAVGTDQHQSSNYTWTFDDFNLPISGPARVGSIEHPYVFPEPIMVSSVIRMYVENGNGFAIPGTPGVVQKESPYECVMHGRVE
jgi:hypothetical protein